MSKSTTMCRRCGDDMQSSADDMAQKIELLQELLSDLDLQYEQLTGRRHHHPIYSAVPRRRWKVVFKSAED